jgi:exosortase/archaeosortase family protein
LFALFAGFVVAFPGKIKNKLWFIPLGILIIHLTNIIRILALAIIAYKSPNYLEFNHNYTFTVSVYIIVFALWMIWTLYFSEIKSIHKNVSKA